MNTNLTRVSGVLWIVAGGFLIGGCASIIAPRIIAPQPGGLQGSYEKSPSGKFVLEDIDAYISAHRRIAVGPPPATLAVAVIPPGHYSLRIGTKQRPDCTTLYVTGSAQTRLFGALKRRCLAAHHMSESELKKQSTTHALSCTAPPVSSVLMRHYRSSIVSLRSLTRPRGTVILLPGYGIGKLSMLPWALMLGQAGYESILVDLRAQGQSTGKYVTYGVLESRDLVQLVAALRRVGLIRGRLGLLGDSMGAVTALLAAAHIPRLAAIVAISPYARASTAIPRYARLALWYGDLIPSESWRAAERKAGRIASVNLADADPINIVPEIDVPVLYVQGGRDKLVSSTQARRLAARTPRSRLMAFPTLGHLQMSEDFAGLAQPIINWYNRYLARNHRQAKPPLLGPPSAKQVALKVTGCVHY